MNKKMRLPFLYLILIAKTKLSSWCRPSKTQTSSLLYYRDSLAKAVAMLTIEIRGITLNMKCTTDTDQTVWMRRLVSFCCSNWLEIGLFKTRSIIVIHNLRK